MWPIITTEQTAAAAAAATPTHTHTQSTDDNNSSRSISSSSSSFSRRLMKTPIEEADEKAAGERPTDHHSESSAMLGKSSNRFPFPASDAITAAAAVADCPSPFTVALIIGVLFRRGALPLTHTHTHTLLLFHCFFIIVIRFIAWSRGEGVLEVLWFCFIILALN